MRHVYILIFHGIRAKLRKKQIKMLFTFFLCKSLVIPIVDTPHWISKCPQYVLIACNVYASSQSSVRMITQLKGNRRTIVEKMSRKFRMLCLSSDYLLLFTIRAIQIMYKQTRNCDFFTMILWSKICRLFDTRNSQICTNNHIIYEYWRVVVHLQFNEYNNIKYVFISKFSCVFNYIVHSQSHIQYFVYCTQLALGHYMSRLLVHSAYTYFTYTQVYVLYLTNCRS